MPPRIYLDSKIQFTPPLVKDIEGLFDFYSLERKRLIGTILGDDYKKREVLKKIPKPESMTYFKV